MHVFFYLFVIPYNIVLNLLPNMIVLCLLFGSIIRNLYVQRTNYDLIIFNCSFEKNDSTSACFFLPLANNSCLYISYTTLFLYINYKLSPLGAVVIKVFC